MVEAGSWARARWIPQTEISTVMLAGSSLQEESAEDLLCRLRHRATEEEWQEAAMRVLSQSVRGRKKRKIKRTTINTFERSVIHAP